MALMLRTEPGATLLFGLPLFHVGGALTQGLGRSRRRHAGGAVAAGLAQYERGAQHLAPGRALQARACFGGVPTVLGARA